VGLEPATPDKEGERAKRITIGDGNSIARRERDGDIERDKCVAYNTIILPQVELDLDRINFSNYFNVDIRDYLSDNLLVR
jgi:hypothetical protein